MSSHILLDYKTNIKDASDLIDKNIELLAKTDPAFCAANIINNVRNLLDAVMKLEYSKTRQTDHTRDPKALLKEAFNHCSVTSGLAPIIRLYNFIEVVSSHITQNEFKSLILIKKYSTLLYDIKELCEKRYGLQVLTKLSMFPFEEIGDDRKKYYSAILDGMKTNLTSLNERQLFYIEKKKRIYINDKSLFEYILSPVSNEKSRYDRLTVYSSINIRSPHSVSCTLAYGAIDIFQSKIKIFYIIDYSVFVMAREFNKFAKLCNLNMPIITRNTNGFSLLMTYLTTNDTSLYEIIVSKNFKAVVKSIFGNKRNTLLVFMTRVRGVLMNKTVLGNHTLTYLLYTFRFSYMKNVEKRKVFDNPLSIDFPLLSSSCFPFEQDPYSFSLRMENPALEDLLMCLPECCTKEKLLKRKIKNSIENNRELYSEIKEYGSDEKITKIQVENYNNTLSNYFKNKNEEILVINEKYLTIKSYEEDVSYIINKIREYTSKTNPNYSRLSARYITNLKKDEIDEDKISFLRAGFSNSSAIIINGSAGTGKTTLIKHFISILSESKFLFTTFTHSALQNLKKRLGSTVNKGNSAFYTLDYLENIKDISDYDCLVIDECSTAANALVRSILGRGFFNYIILVGDETQIQSIKFGNWFSLAINCFPSIASNLTMIHRSDSQNLQLLWAMAREKNQMLLEKMTNFSGLIKPIQNILSDKNERDEIVLCLNYDGPYGVNNINRYLQEKNEENAISWNVWTFKKNDRIIFNGCNKYKNYFFNNQKGVILELKDLTKIVEVIVGIPFSNDNNRINNRNVSYLGNDGVYDKYLIHIAKQTLDEETADDNSIVPFQLGYAVSIHKSQGLEFESVKIIIAKEVEEVINHSIFYTAITRTKNKLTLYTDVTSLQYIIDNFENNDFSRDLGILRSRGKIN